MRALIIIGLVACNGGDDTSDSGSSSGITAPEVGTDPAETAGSTEDVDAVILTESEGPGEITYTYSWLSGGETWAQATLPASVTTKGQTWTLTVTPYAGEQSGPSGQASVSIANGPPSVEAAVFDPSTPTIGLDLACLPVNPVDPDSDTLSYTYVWERDGSALTETTGLLSASEVLAGSTITCSLTVTDGEDTGNTVSVSGSALNSPPTATGSTISPSTPISTDDLTCTGEGGSDPDGDTVTFTYQWTVNGGSPVAETGAVLAESYFVGGDVVICTARPYDGAATGPGVPSTPVTIGNAPPEISQVLISPLAPVYGDTLTCTPTASDPDNDSLTYTYEWTINGAVQAETSDFYTGSFVYSDNIVCTATASDGQATASLASTTAVVANSPPTISGASITPSTAAPDEALTCIAGTTSDVDGQNVTVSFAWDVGGNSFSGAILPANSGSVGTVATCTVTPHDGLISGTAAQASLTFTNEAPPQPTVAITPTSPVHADSITCSATPATDSEGDAITYTYTWTVGGSQVGTGATLPANTVTNGDALTCTAVGNDGFADGPPGVASVTVANTPPPTPSVSISPTSGTTTTSFTCSASPATDSEGEAITYSYEWTVGGNLVGSAATLPANTVPGGQTAVCEATGTDGTDSASATAQVAIANTPPPSPTVSISPGSGTTATAFSCAASPTSDADGHTITYTYAWFVDGGAAGTGTSFSGTAVGGQALRCDATGNDGIDDGPTGSDSLVIENSPPTVASVSLTPTTAYESTVFNCTANSSDLDGQTPTPNYRWTVNGTTVASGTTETELDGADFNKGQNVQCHVTASDGIDTSAEVSSAVVTVQNTAPTAPTNVRFSPSSPVAQTSSLVCSASGAYDDDTDGLSYQFSWRRNGSNFTSTTTSTWPGDTIRASDQYTGDVFRCTAAAYDGTVTGPSASNTVTIQAPPEYTIGWPTADATTRAGSFGANYLLGMRVTVPSNATLLRMGLITSATTGNGRLVLYADSGGTPTTRVAMTPAFPLTGGTQELSVGGVNLPAGSYWIMGVYDVTTPVSVQDQSISYKYFSHPFTTTPPTTYPTTHTTYTSGNRAHYYLVLQ